MNTHLTSHFKCSYLNQGKYQFISFFKNITILLCQRPQGLHKWSVTGSHNCTGLKMNAKFNANPCLSSCSSLYSSISSSYSTRHSKIVGRFLVAARNPSIYSKVCQTVGYSFAFDAPIVRNTLPDEIHTFPLFIASFRKELKSYLYTTVYPLWSYPHDVFNGT